MSTHLATDLTFDWQADHRSDLERDRLALAAQYRLCRHALSPVTAVGALMDRAQAYAVPRLVTLFLTLALLLMAAMSIG